MARPKGSRNNGHEFQVICEEELTTRDLKNLLIAFYYMDIDTPVSVISGLEKTIERVSNLII